ncbi:MAG: PD-(D/E)XK nuclease family transposase, partial [Spirochaetota bacterium]
MLRAVNDMVFKFIFGEESRKELLRELINLVLEGVGLPLAATVTIRNPFSLRKFASDKEAVLDFEASDNSGRLFDLEMQIKLQETYGARALYYWSRVCGRLENLLHLLESEGGDQAMIESLTEGDRFFAEVDEA